MKRFTVLAIICASIIFLSPGFAKAQVMEYDPLKRNLLTVEGDFDKEFPVNVFKLKFGFDIQKNNFSETNAYSAQIISTITKAVDELKLSNVKIIKGWDIVKQAKISVGNSGSKLSNQLIIEVRDFPPDRMQSLITAIIDKSLAADKEVFLENVEVGITKDAEDKYKEEVLTEALKRLKVNAEKAAETQSRKIIATKRIFVLSDEAVVSKMKEGMAYDMMSEERSMAKKSFVSVQKGFTVRSDITDHIKIAARVAGIYEID